MKPFCLKYNRYIKNKHTYCKKDECKHYFLMEKITQCNFKNTIIYCASYWHHYFHLIATCSSIVICNLCENDGTDDCEDCVVKFCRSYIKGTPEDYVIHKNFIERPLLQTGFNAR